MYVADPKDDTSIHTVVGISRDPPLHCYTGEAFDHGIKVLLHVVSGQTCVDSCDKFPESDTWLGTECWPDD